ncbi:MAG TPA: tetratricopeptide repeat protein [Verrucomicrobiae bacterium]|nr:tetratricopeptide repeat protein [Verrucomicrobiae bacterium]
MRKHTQLIRMLAVVSLFAMTVVGCTAKVKAQYHESRANQYFNAGQYDQAEIEYRKVLQNTPQNAQAWSRLGTIYFDQGRLAPAAQILGRAQQLDATNLEVRVKLAAIYLAVGQQSNAQVEASFVLDKNPGDAQAPLLLAESVQTNQIAETRARLQKLSQVDETAPLDLALGAIAMRQRDLISAEAYFLKAVKLDPKSADAYSALGNLYVAQKDLKRADQNFKTAADLAPPRSGKVLRYAQFKMATGDAAAGKQLLEDMVKKTPDYLPAWIELAQIAASDKKYEDGLTLLGNVLSRDPQNLDALLLKGRLELQAGQTAQAIADGERTAKIYPQVPPVFYQLALAYVAGGDTDKAADSLNQALRLNPRYVEANLALADIQIRTGNAGSAVASLQQLTQEQPRLAPAQLLLALGYRVQGNLDGAAQIYRVLAQANPTNAQFPLLLGTTLVQEKKNDEARTQFDTALKLAPDNMQALDQLVRLDLSEKQFAAAQQRVQQKIAQYPKAAALQLLLANVMVARGDTNAAESALQKVIELQPDAQPAYLMLAQLHTAAGQNQKALADLQSALAKNPKNASALLLMGMTYEAETNYPAARDAYEQVLTVASNSVVALNNLACLYAAHLGQLDKAYQLARRARNLAPAEPSVADTLGWILYQQGQYSSALSLLRESAAKMSDVPDAQFHLGMTCYAMGDEANAKTTLQRVLQLDGNYVEKAKCNQCLKVMAVDPKTAGADTRAWLEKYVATQPKDSIALLRLAAIDQNAGMVDKAVAAYESALQASPQNVTAMVNLARLTAAQDPQKAFNLAKSAYNLSPNDPLVVQTLGRMAFLTGDYKWSLSLLQLAAQARPQNPEVLYDLGQALYSMGKVPEARTAVQNALQTGVAFAQTNEARQFVAMAGLADKPAQALAARSQITAILKSSPDYVPALMASASIVEQKPDLAAAEQTYETVLKHYPDFAPAQKQLAILYSKDPANDAKAYPLAVKARDAFPGDSEVARTLGIIVYRQGDYSRAANLLQESARERASDAELMFYLGMAQYHLKHNAESKTALQKALNLNLSGTNADEARRILAELK